MVLFLAACGNDEPPPPDVSGQRVDLEVLRFDRALAAVDTTAAAPLDGLRRDYGDFVEPYFTHLLPLYRRDIRPAERPLVLRAYLDYPLTGLIDSVVRQRFPADGSTLRPLVADLEQSLRYFQHYFPEAKSPDTLVLYTSHFELAAFLYGDGQLAAGLDFFLGPDFDYAAVNPEEPIFSAYLSRSYTPQHFTGKLLRVLVDDLLPAPRAGRLLDYLIYEGKKLYVLGLLQPDRPDHLLYEISPGQMAWLRDNETEVYTYLQREDLLYSTDPEKAQRYTQPSPTSTGMPRESPGGAVNYLGRQIVAAFVRSNPDVDLREMLALEDGQELLRRARYKPR